MPKKMKLKLNELKVKSFVTLLENNAQDVKVGGGTAPITCPLSCGGPCTENTCMGTPCCETMDTDCSCNTCDCVTQNTCGDTCKLILCPW